MIIIMKLKIEGRVWINTAFILAALFVFTSCGKTNKTDNISYENSGFAVRTDDYLYYIKYAPAQADLYQYNIADGNEVFVDNIYNSDANNIRGMTKMFNIDNRIFYGKGIKDGTAIYSVDSKSLQPVFEGNINEPLDAFNGEYPTQEFRMYKYNDEIYVLANYKIYKLNKENTEVVYDNINSLYISDNKCYYSLFKEDILPASEGIWCYDLEKNNKRELVSENVIKDYNYAETISGDSCEVENIIADDEQIYFLGANDPIEISMYNTKTDKINNLMSQIRTRMFKKYGDKLYFINVQHQLCSVSDNETDVNFLIKDSYVYSFSIYKDKIYYYKVTDDIGYPSELIEYDMNEQTHKIIAKFT